LDLKYVVFNMRSAGLRLSHNYAQFMKGRKAVSAPDASSSVVICVTESVT